MSGHNSVRFAGEPHRCMAKPPISYVCIYLNRSKLGKHILPEPCNSYFQCHDQYFRGGLHAAKLMHFKAVKEKRLHFVKALFKK